MRMRIGPSEGNSGAIFRWGEYLDNGIWIQWRYPRRWLKKRSYRYMRGYLSLGVVEFRWGN